MAINENRKKKMQKKTTNELVQIVKSGSLSAAAAEFELRARGVKNLLTGDK